MNIHTRGLELAVGLLICLLVSLGTVWVFPGTEGEAALLKLPDTVGDSTVAPGFDDVAATLIESGVRDEPWLEYRWARFELVVPQGGRYTLHGRCANHSRFPMDLSVNGREITSMAFWQNTGLDRGGTGRYLLAKNVTLSEGANTFYLDGNLLEPVPIVLELRRQKAFPLVRFSLTMLAVAGLLALRRLTIRRLKVSPLVQTAATLCLVPLVVLAGATALYKSQGDDLVSIGYEAPMLLGRLAEFEEALGSEAHLAAREDAFEICVLGDSTHEYHLPRDMNMRPLLERKLAAEGQDDVHIYGLQSGAFSPWDYYLLLNRVARTEQPDLLVMPVNLRFFTGRWLRRRFAILEQYLMLSEFPRVRGVSVAGRQLRWPNLIGQRLDARLFDGRLSPYLRGTRVYLDREEERVIENLYGNWEDFMRPLPADIYANLTEYRDWDDPITADHGMFGVYELISRFARERGIAVLYYSAQMNEEAQLALGLDLQLEENFAVVEEQLLHEDGVRFLNLVESNPPEMFSDDWDHLTPLGIDRISDALVAEIVAFRLEQ